VHKLHSFLCSKLAQTSKDLMFPTPATPAKHLGISFGQSFSLPL
jgi:hypothetical protein